MPGSLQDAASYGLQRKHVTRTDEVRRGSSSAATAVRIVWALIGGADTGGHAVPSPRSTSVKAVEREERFSIDHHGGARAGGCGPRSGSGK